MSAPSRCPECGAPLTAAGAACPRCLLAAGLEAGEGPKLGPGFLDDLPWSGRSIRYIGDYELLAVIARGGMGVVYQARQVSLNRVVAFKMLLGGGHAGDQFKLRFQMEAGAAARLQHPNIVQVFEVGDHEGQPYFSMEYVAGQTLAQMVREQPLSPKEAAEYVKTVAEAVHFAHQQGVLHRDLKPSNILVRDDGRVVVTDFGLARQLDADANLTLSGQALGTPGYMPPEQVAQKFGATGPWSDVYALGAVLYHLLTGRPPFAAATVAEVLRQVVETEPVPLRKLNPTLPADLETICLKCLEKSPGNRLANPEILAQELGRFLRDEPIRSRPIAPWERVRKWYRRRPVVAWLTTALATVLLLGATLTSFEFRQTLQTNVRLRRALIRMRVSRAESMATEGRHNEMLAGLARAVREAPESPVAPNLLMDEFLHRPPARLVCPPLFHEQLVTDANFSRDGSRIITVSYDGTAKLWNATNGALLLVLTNGLPLNCFTESPDGRWLLTGDTNGGVVVWNRLDGRRRLSLHYGGNISALAVSDDGQLFATASSDHTARCWRMSDGRPWGRVIEHSEPINYVSFEPGRRRILTASDDSTARVSDPAAGASTDLVVHHSAAVSYAEFNARGDRFVTASADHTAVVWRTQNGKPVGQPLRHQDALRYAHFSKDGKRIVTTSFDATAGVWSADSGKLFAFLGPHGNVVEDAAFSADGNRVVTASQDYRTQVWEATTGRPMGPPIYGGDATYHARFSAGGELVLTAGDSGGARLWRLPKAANSSQVFELQDSPGELLRQPGGAITLAAGNAWGRLPAVKGQSWLQAVGAKGQIAGIRLARNQKRALLLTEEKEVFLWELGLHPRRLGQWPDIEDAAISPDGNTFAMVAANGLVTLHSMQPNLPVRHWQIKCPGPVRVKWAPEDSRFAVVCGKDLYLFPSHSKAGPQPWFAGEEVIDALEWSLDGRWLLVRLHEHGSGVFVLDSYRATVQCTGPAHRTPINVAAFSRTGRWVATGSVDGTVQVWETTSGKLAGRPFKQSGEVTRLDWDEADRRLLTGTSQGNIQVWEPVSGLSLSWPVKLPGELIGAAFGTRASVWVALAQPNQLHELHLPYFPAPAPDWLPQLAEYLAGFDYTSDESEEPSDQADLFNLVADVLDGSSSPYRDWFISYWTNR